MVGVVFSPKGTGTGMKKMLIMAAMAALLAGCYTADRHYYNEPVGGTAAYDGTYRYYGSSISAPLPGLTRCRVSAALGAP